MDIHRPSVARVYDYYLGGSHNFAADREFAEKVLSVLPDMPRIAHQNRAFLRRAVRYLCGEGIGQFLDLGSGIPTAGPTPSSTPPSGPGSTSPARSACCSCRCCTSWATRTPRPS